MSFRSRALDMYDASRADAAGQLGTEIRFGERRRRSVELRRARLSRTARDAQRSTDRLQLAAIVESLSEAVFSKSLDGTIESWNTGAERLYGYQAHEVVGKPVNILVPPEREHEIEEILARLRLGQTVEQFETVRRRKDSTEVHVSLSASPVRRPDGTIVGGYVVAHDVSKLVRREEIQRLLAEASRLLAVNADIAKTLGRIARLALSCLADVCTIEIAEEMGDFARVVTANADPKNAELMREIRLLYPPDRRRPDIRLRVLATGKAELIPDVSEILLENIAQDAEHLRMLRELALRSLIVVPLRARGRAIGTIVLANTEPGRRFTSEDLDLAEDLARRVALAVDNAVLHEAEQEAQRKSDRAADWVRRLQTATAALSGAATPVAAAEVLVREGCAAMAADGGFVRLLTPGGDDLELIAVAGYPTELAESHANLSPADDDPAAETFRSRISSYFESAAAVSAASPEFGVEHAACGREAIAFVPLNGQRRMIGVIALSFATRRSFEADEREFLSTLASHGGQAIERAQMYEAERAARAAAVRAVERTTSLQALAGALADTLTLRQVADVVVAQGMASAAADAGALHLLSEDGETLELLRARGSDPDLIGVEWQRIPIDLELPSSDAVRRREPVFVESEKDMRASYPRMPTKRPALRARAGAHIPLIVSDQLLGVLFLGFSRPRKFSDSQRAFVLALGRQAAQALKRSQLYEAEREARSRLSRLVERLQEGVVSVDRRGRVDFASSTAKRMLSPAQLEEGSQAPEEWLGFPLRSFIAGLFDTDEPVIEAQIDDQGGQRFFEVVGIPAAGAEAALVLVRDVSERERRQRVEREFVANAAHELRTPLAAITSSVERLQAGARDNPEKRDRYLGHIQNESARLNRLASSLLVLARAQMREEEPRRDEIGLLGMVEDIATGLELDAGVELVLDCPPELVAYSNRDLLEHALLNLLSNAARHTDSGRICVSADSDHDGTITIEVTDTGVGIPTDELNRLFDRFYRGSGGKGRAGFGLGLPIVKEAVEAIDGRIEIESIAGTGTTARVVLPVVQPSVVLA